MRQDASHFGDHCARDGEEWSPGRIGQRCHKDLSPLQLAKLVRPQDDTRRAGYHAWTARNPSQIALRGLRLGVDLFITTNDVGPGPAHVGVQFLARLSDLVFDRYLTLGHLIHFIQG